MNERFRRTKIVATLGPASSDSALMSRMLHAGVDVVRLNFSHGDHSSHQRLYLAVREVAEKLGRPVAVLADLSGPKMRVGELPGGSIQLIEGAVVRLEPKTASPVESIQSVDRFGSSVATIPIGYPHLANEVAVGEAIYLDDGKLKLTVERIDGPAIVACVEVGGPLKSRKGLNARSAGDSIQAMTEKDRIDLEFAKRLGVDFFALSFVRKAEDVELAKSLAGSIPVIAKMEKPAGIDRLDAIADAADGLMVARGDLGIEIGFERVPILQKKIIAACNRRAKPVIIATQMLETMIESPTPTRAEVSDVANAVLDGADAVMLSAESASGSYPVESVETMRRIIEQVEQGAGEFGRAPDRSAIDAPNFQNAIAHAAARAAIDLKLKAVVVYSQTGRSISLVSAYRPSCPIVGVVPTVESANRAALHWGVRCFQGDWKDDVGAVVDHAERLLLERRLVSPGDEIGVTFGLNDETPPGTTMLKLWRVRPRIG